MAFRRAKRTGREAVRWLLLKTRLLPKEEQVLKRIDESKFSPQSRALIWCIQRLAVSEKENFEGVFKRISRVQAVYPKTKLVLVTGSPRFDAELAQTAFALQALERPVEVTEKELSRCQRQLKLLQSQKKRSKEAIAHWRAEVLARQQELALLEDKAILLQKQIKASILQSKKA